MDATHIIEKTKTVPKTSLRRCLKEVLTHAESGVVCEEVSTHTGYSETDSDDDFYHEYTLAFKVDRIEVIFHLAREDHDTNESELTTDILVKENNKKTLNLRRYDSCWFFNGDNKSVQELLCRSQHIFGTHYRSVAKCISVIVQNHEELDFY